LSAIRSSPDLYPARVARAVRCSVCRQWRGLPVFMNVRGKFQRRVFANEYLTRVNLMAAYQFREPTLRCSTASASDRRRRQRRDGFARTAKRMAPTLHHCLTAAPEKRSPPGGGTPSCEEEGMSSNPRGPGRSVGQRPALGSRTEMCPHAVGEPDASGRARRSRFPALNS